MKKSECQLESHIRPDGKKVLTCKGIWYGQGYYPLYDCDKCPLMEN